MNFNKLKSNKGNIVNGIFLINPKIFTDTRGFFYESWNQFIFNKEIGNINFCQDNHSKSSKGVLRGLHYQIDPYAQGKLVRCTRGRIFDIAIDLRKSSCTYKEWISLELDEINKSLLWIPKGFGHGFLALSNDTEVQYKVTKNWNPKYEKSLLWNDPDLNINWPLSQLDCNFPIISKKDSQGITIKKAENLDFVFS